MEVEQTSGIEKQLKIEKIKTVFRKFKKYVFTGAFLYVTYVLWNKNNKNEDFLKIDAYQIATLCFAFYFTYLRAEKREKEKDKKDIISSVSKDIIDLATNLVDAHGVWIDFLGAKRTINNRLVILGEIVTLSNINKKERLLYLKNAHDRLIDWNNEVAMMYVIEDDKDKKSKDELSYEESQKLKDKVIKYKEDISTNMYKIMIC